MPNQKKTKVILILVFTLLPLLVQNSQERSNETNHNEENKKLLKKAVEIHKLFNELKKERKPAKEKYKELQRMMMRKLQRGFARITTNQNQKETIKLSSLGESKKEINKLSLYEIKNIQTQSVRQLKTLPSPQMKPISLSNSISLRSRTNNFILKLHKTSGTESLYKPSVVEYKDLCIKKSDLLHKLTGLQKKVEKVINKWSYNYQHYIEREHFSHELNSIMKSLKNFIKKVGTLISEVTKAEYSELSYEKLREFKQGVHNLENYYRTNLLELINQLPEKVRKFDNLILRLKNLEKLIPIVASGKEPYSYLGAKERRKLYENICREYKGIIDELEPDESVAVVKSFFHFYKAFPDFVVEKTQMKKEDNQQNKPTGADQTTLIINNMKKLALLSILTNQINSIITYSDNIKDPIKSNLQSSPIVMSQEEAKNCKNWKVELGEYQLKDLVFDDNGEIRLKDDFLFFSNKETLNKIIKKAQDCTDSVLPGRIKELLDGLTPWKGIIHPPITTYKNLFEYINTTIPLLLRDIEEIKTVNIYQRVAKRIIRLNEALQQQSRKDPKFRCPTNREIIKWVITDFELDSKRIECFVNTINENISSSEYVAPDLGRVSSKLVEDAFKTCDIKENIVEKRINGISFEKLSSLTENSGEILKSSIRLFNSCSEIYLEDIPKLIKFKYEIFVKTFNLLWDKFLFAPDFKDRFLEGEDCDDWRKNYYKETWRDNYICIVRLHQHASAVLQELYSKKELELNKDLFTNLCLGEMKGKQNLQTKFWKSLEGSPLLPRACRIVKIYQKGIEINRIDDINERIGIILLY